MKSGGNTADDDDNDDGDDTQGDESGTDDFVEETQTGVFNQDASELAQEAQRRQEIREVLIELLIEEGILEEKPAEGAEADRREKKHQEMELESLERLIKDKNILAVNCEESGKLVDALKKLMDVLNLTEEEILEITQEVEVICETETKGESSE